uniref:Uncharacterized protein n=1 Tax=Sus scrofa TaxID=9823 RepID=A0A4X1SMX1_PIG
MSIQVFCPFLIGLFYFSLSCMSCLYMLDTNPLLVILFATIFFHSVGCLFILLRVSFAVQKLLSLIRSHLFIFAFIYFALGDGSKKPKKQNQTSLRFMSRSVPPMLNILNTAFSNRII